MGGEDMGRSVPKRRGSVRGRHDRHLDIRDKNVGGQPGNGVQRVATVCGAGYDGDVRLQFEQRGECAQHHGLVFSKDDANRRAHMTHGAFTWRVDVCGSSMRRVTPGSVVIDKRPPSDCTRSRMPRRPLPSRRFG